MALKAVASQYEIPQLYWNNPQGCSDIYRKIWDVIARSIAWITCGVFCADVSKDASIVIAGRVSLTYIANYIYDKVRAGKPWDDF